MARAIFRSEALCAVFAAVTAHADLSAARYPRGAIPVIPGSQKQKAPAAATATTTDNGLAVLRMQHAVA
jgi:hypothetical protein